ncbi:head-tail connector protein [Ancylobacter sp. WKF20]|uniref:head-tail connector protein n=1 Tax=Ancylobacter sp. WKF20 TaxID=3039801 RepID=UPI0024342A72|nr:head-tail connector protein [Ancylobacter sp. WKF20]WGD31882.1 head-tail connector protein [Ancylobacter sp. WKF20]
MTEATDIVPLADMKQHMRVDYDDDDGAITDMLDAARRHIEAWVGPLDDFEAVPSDISEAMKKLVVHFYEVRNAAGEDAMSVIPFGVHDLIGPYRKWEF